ncbi:MAG: 30S ribosomal protein S3 [Candidatus Woesearchaeota archaeon]|jgi:small subunit ribosomal protein S3|nr:30S ribosomal protein S3 [Candidatus Woesearchaeota archaeon]MDP6600163.1 30S ribosomal protein S3 [Candidatus Woesearchaeota archaeon]|tara:strand:- start:10321 stop:11148 length:828 start_codon:yes stop_codon:yes gene_type:complete
MIERKFIAQKTKEYQIQEYINENLKNVGHSHTKMVKTPLGEKIVLYASRPGLIVGRKGQNIKELTKTLKKRFGLENPQIEISEVTDINLDANIVAERIANSLERFGTQKFKAIGHRVMEDVISAGALGIEITVSGKIPSSRAKSWRFYSGYLKKCGNIAIVDVDKAYVQAKLKTGVVGIKVSLMPPGIKLPDKVELIEEKEEKIEEVSEENKEGKNEIKPKAKKTAKTNARTKSNAVEKEAEDKNPDEEKAEKESVVKPHKEPAPNVHDGVKNED